MSKQVKRKITVNIATKNKTLNKTRPSVFDRLGTKASSSSTTSVHNKEFCHHWAQNGTCPYGKNCKYSLTHTLISPSKQRAAKKENEKKRHSKENVPHNKRLQVNLKGVGAKNDDDEWNEEWDPDELEDADPDDLEKRRQELQRELELQMKMESKARKKKVKKESSPSSDSSSSTSDSSTSSDDSSSSSSSSVDTRRNSKKAKKCKVKRDSSSSSDDRLRKHKSNKHKIKGSKIVKTKPAKSPSPVVRNRKSQTPPPKIMKTLTPVKKAKSESKSPRPQSRLSRDKYTPSPKVKEKEKEKEREREKEREKEKEKEKEREKEKLRMKEREKEKEQHNKKKSPKHETKLIKDTKKKDSPDRRHEDRKLSSPNRSRGNRRENKERTSLPKDDRRRDERDRSRTDKTRNKDSNKRDSRERERDRDRDREREHDRDRDREHDRDRERDHERDREREHERDRERERRIAREEREAAREKEREEALARCQERQRERERLKELAKKEEMERRNRDKNRTRDDRGLDKPGFPSLPPRKDHSLEKDRGDRRDRRTPDRNRSNRKSLDKTDRNMDRYDRNNYDNREHDEREYPRYRHDDKRFDSPYERNRHEDRRFLEMDHYSETSRDDRLMDAHEYNDDRRQRRENMWERDMDREMVDHRRYGREDNRPPPPPPKGGNRDWEGDYQESDWMERNNRRGVDWDQYREHEQHGQMDEEWRHYNRPPIDNWNENRRWQNDWREISRPRSQTSHNRDEEIIEPPRRKEPVEVEPKKETLLGKRPAEVPPPEPPVEAKKPCIIKEIPLEDDLSEISDDADEILNRDEDIPEQPVEEPVQEEPEKPPEVPAANAEVIVPPKAPASPEKSITKEETIDEENMELDFEEISEDELEEEARIKGIGDALGVDWSSLVAESRPRVKPISSAKIRWESHNVLVNLGISIEMAGEKLVDDILKEHQQFKANQQLKDNQKLIDVQQVKEESKDTIIVKNEENSATVNGLNDTKVEIKTENVEANDVKVKAKADPKIETETIENLQPIAEIQVATREKQAIRKTLFNSAGPYRRALSARRDLIIRRHLCNLPLLDTFVEAPKRHDADLYKLAVELFERTL